MRPLEYMTIATLIATAACGGAQPSTKREMTQMAKEAPPPPKEVTPGAVVERKVSREAKTDFAEAVKFFKAQAEGGWTNPECTAAADKFLDVAKAHDKMVEAYFNAGVAYQMCGDMKNAEENYLAALRVNPSHAPSLANLGEIYFRGGNETRAKEYFEKAVQADGLIVSARVNLGWIFYQKMRSEPSQAKAHEEAAFGHLQRALASDNDNVAAYTVMALIFMEGASKNRNRLDVAALLLERGKAANDSYAPLHNALGLLALQRGNIKKALDNFEKATNLDPKFIEARMNLAQIVLSFRKYDRAEQLFREVLALKPNKDTQYKATVGLGVAIRGVASQLRASGDVPGSEAKIKEALDQYQAAIGIDGKKGDAYFNIGLLYKDYKTNNDRLEDNKKSYIEAKKYFEEFRSRGGSDDKMAEAKDHIEDCEKYVKILDQAIQQQNATPPPPAPTPGATAPTSPPAGKGNP